ncbi:FliM/FliN family flagellar motor switch protein [Paracoccus sp. MC1854]|uniref:FliM/FliN family flagellar motor switch protein n=1 Tax=Paracoccus sp. MC1854 TaxID=2760306 RepID=UPI001603F500|nr:FliM/FliN family flagellar motor C-terminal domain-containing protein [Paracoccus sp. MC1854]MBB1490429.1 FliM/FliN family flagellar motor switch protein [Paracoccus sp. MC1854]
MQAAAENGKAPAGGSALRRHVAAAGARRAAAGAASEAAALPISTGRGLDRIVAGAIGRAADRVHGLRLFFDRLDYDRAALAELAELFPERALISVVEGPGEALGVVAICPGLLGAVIEMQATGRISARAPSVRRPTRADGLICADLINACLSELGEELVLPPDGEGLRGFRYASFLEDPRPLELMLEDGSFHLVQARLRAGETGQRDGRILIALPARPEPAARPATAMAVDKPALAPAGASAAATLSEAVRAAPIDLAGILCRRMISLGELRGLMPGDMIALPPHVLANASLETATGQVLFRGKLGELAGRHALRLTREAEKPAVPEPAARDQGAGALTGPIHRDAGEPPIADLDAPDEFRHGDMASLPLKAG